MLIDICNRDGRYRSKDGYGKPPSNILARAYALGLGTRQCNTTAAMNGRGNEKPVPDLARESAASYAAFVMWFDPRCDNENIFVEGQYSPNNEPEVQ